MGTVNHDMIIPALRGERSKSARVNGDRIMACLSDQDGADPSFMSKGLPLSKKVKEYASLVTHFLANALVKGTYTSFAVNANLFLFRMRASKSLASSFALAPRTEYSSKKEA
jgi:hypothetical protein